MSVKSTTSSTNKDDLIAETKAMVISTDNTLRQVADNVALLQDRHSMSLREIAAEIGKSHAWVCRILKWREEGFKGTPFGPAAKAARTRRASGETTRRRKRGASGQATDHQETNATATATEEANTETAEATGGAQADAGTDANAQASADARKAEYAAAEAGADLEGFVDRWLSELDDDMVTKAKALVAAWERKVGERAEPESAPAPAGPDFDDGIPPFLRRTRSEPKLRAAA